MDQSQSSRLLVGRSERRSIYRDVLDYSDILVSLGLRNERNAVPRQYRLDDLLLRSQHVFSIFYFFQRATYRTGLQVDECLFDRLDRIDLSQFIDRKPALLIELN